MHTHVLFLLFFTFVSFLEYRVKVSSLRTYYQIALFIMHLSLYTAKKLYTLLAVIAISAVVLAPFAFIQAQAPAQGTLTINKEIVGTTTVSASDFSFLINGASTTAFDIDGTNEVVLNVGTYTITEEEAEGFTTTYEGCADIALSESGAVCTITNTAEASTTPQTGTLEIRKELVGTTTATADAFTFDVLRNLIVPQYTDEPFESDGVNVYTVPTGAYTITEDESMGFATTYANSLNGDANCATLEVTADATTTCTITNTVIPATTTEAIGTLVVQKVVNGGDTATSSFDFEINGASTTAFDADGETVISLATGTYSITEVPYANYTPSYDNCTDIVIAENATTTCVITNDFNVGGETLYVIEGYIWDDEDEDGVFDEDEDPVANWDVRAERDGEITRYDTTDAEGYYSMLVTEGTWLVYQTLDEGWIQTFPEDDQPHTVVVEGEEESELWWPLNLIFSVAQAQAGPNLFNFGIAQVAPAYSQGSYGGGGGNGVRIELRDDTDDDNDRDEDEDEDDDDSSASGGSTSGTQTPGGVVLGDATSVYPVGGVNAGAGGMAADHPYVVVGSVILMVGALILLDGRFRKEDEEEPLLQ